MARIIVVGNEKGGAGKSTVSMHVATALVRSGKTVGTLDLDLRQQSLSHYVENRIAFAKAEGIELPMMKHVYLPDVAPQDVPAGENQYDYRLSLAVSELDKDCEYIIIDCPGSHTRLSQVAHSLADTLITPMNDSYVDFDLLGKVDSSGETVLGPSIYSEMVWSARQLRAQAGLPPVDWIVLRNRLGAQQMVNKRKISQVLTVLSKRIGFRVAPGFNERVIFRELFPRGLTLLDLRDVGVRQLNISNISARQEVRDLIKALRLPDVNLVA